MPPSGAPTAPTGPAGPKPVTAPKVLGGYSATAYCGNFSATSINGTGVTAGGTDLRDKKQHYVIAAGAGSGLTIGDVVTITPNPFGDDQIRFKVDDHGGAIFGHHIDIYVADCAKAKAWGRRSVSVQKWQHGSATGPSSQSLGDFAGGLVPNPIKSVADFLSHLGIIFQGGFWLRVLQGLGGLVLIVLGLIMAARGMTIGTASKILAGKVKA